MSGVEVGYTPIVDRATAPLKARIAELERALRDAADAVGIKPQEVGTPAMRAWAVKGADGIWLSSLDISKRNVERALCQEYTGSERGWNPTYRQMFEDDLATRLENEGLEVVQVEVTEIK